MSVAGIILAAGFSRRLGRPKQTAELGGETLLERSARVALAAALRPLFAVVSPTVVAKESLLATSLHERGCELLFNVEAEEGMAASIRCGVAAAMEVEGLAGAVVLTCDQVAVRPEHLRALYASTECVVGSRYAHRTGVPAYFPKIYFPHLLALRGDTGARDLLRSAEAIETEDLAFDVDTQEDLATAQRRFGGSAPAKL